MPTVLLLTTDDLPHYDLDTGLLAEALEGRGITVRTENWHDPALATVDADLAMIRSTWDYPTRLDSFLAVLDRLPVPVFNPPAVARWNSHKGYLADLGIAGVPVVPTTVIPRGSTGGLPDTGAEQIVIKPAVSAGAVGVGLFAAGSAAAAAHLERLLSSGDALVQPFQESVRDGERSLIYLGGGYSHAVHKVPADGEFRVQEQHGGVNQAYTATGAEIEVAEQTIAAVPGGGELLYARVDLVGPQSAPQVMEIELIEPELFLPLAPGSADRLADALIARL